MNPSIRRFSDMSRHRQLRGSNKRGFSWRSAHAKNWATYHEVYIIKTKTACEQRKKSEGNNVHSFNFAIQLSRTRNGSADFVLRAPAAQKLLQQRKPLRRCAAKTAAIHASRSENDTLKDQVAGLLYRSFTNHQWQQCIFEKTDRVPFSQTLSDIRRKAPAQVGLCGCSISARYFS